MNIGSITVTDHGAEYGRDRFYVDSPVELTPAQEAECVWIFKQLERERREYAADQRVSEIKDEEETA